MMVGYLPYTKIKASGSYSVIVYAMVHAFWSTSDYKNLLRFLEGKYIIKADEHSISSMIAEFYNLDFTTPYEVSMWLKQKIRKKNK